MRTVKIEQFPGLDLRADAGDSRGAVDMINVTLEPGRVRTRDGTLPFVGVTAGRPVFALGFPRASFASTIAIGCQLSGATDLSIYSSAGALVSATTLPGLSTQGASGLIFGTPTNTYMYVTCTSAALVRRWDGTVWTTPATFPASLRCFGLSPTDNRAAACASGSKVWFSNVGSPETYPANNFVQLTPGDGEEIMATAVFNNQLIIFKNTKYFVFYGNSVDATGNPIFNYRVVDARIGVSAGGGPQSVCVAPDGVYFVAADGVYRTTGGPPTCISGPVAPFFAGKYPGAAPFWPTTQYSIDTGSRIAWLRNKLYVASCTNATTLDDGMTMVYDQDLKAWSAWSLHTEALTVFSPDSAPNSEPSLMIGTIGVTRFATAAVAFLYRDTPSSVVASRYQLPFEDYGNPGRKHIRETLLEGTGTPTVKWAKDWGSLPTGSAVPLGTLPTIGGGRQRLSTLGNSFSLQLGATSTAWSVNRVQVNIHDAIAGPEIS